MSGACLHGMVETVAIPHAAEGWTKQDMGALIGMSDLIDKVKQTAEVFAAELRRLATEDPILRTAVLRMGVRDVAWALADTFPQDREELELQLDDMGEIIERMRKEPKAPEANDLPAV